MNQPVDEVRRPWEDDDDVDCHQESPRPPVTEETPVEPQHQPYQPRPIDPPRSISYGWPYQGDRPGWPPSGTAGYSPRQVAAIERMIATVDRSPRSFEGLR
jgi:hypothetical protein